MSFEWPTKRLGDCCEKIGSGATPKGGKDAYLEVGPVHLIRSQNVHNDGFSPSGLAFISEEQAKKLDNVKVESGDVLLNITGDSVARVCQALNQFLPARVNQHVAIIRPKSSEFDTRFVRYFLASPAQQDYMLGLAAAGATRNALTKVMIESFQVPCPPLSVQQGIADVLASLDNRITLLRETNTTLEAIAQALFKSWFVDFDPVHAKMQGRAPEGMDQATAALFPDSFEESELGPVPKGWRVERLGDVSSYLNRGISPKYLEEGGVLVVNQKCIRDYSVDYSKARRHDSTQRKIVGRQIEVGDILVNSTGVGTLGRVAQVLALVEETIVDSHVTVVRSGKKLSWPYLGQWMVRQQPNIEAMGEGSTGQTELSRSKLAMLPILVPSVVALTAFDALVKSLKERVAVNETCISELAKLRDTLLPRLISGQLQLPDAQQNFEEAL